MNAREGLSDHGPHAQMTRSQGRVLAAGPLTVVLPGHNDRRPPRIADGFGPMDKFGVHPAEHVTGDGGHIRAQ